MKKEKIIVLMMVVVALTGCADRELLTSDTDAPVMISLGFSMPDAAIAKTRMADSVVQTSGLLYRGLQDVHIIPFAKQGKIQVDDLPYLFEADHDEDGRVSGKPTTEYPDAAFYYYPECSFWAGTASVLFYGRGAASVKVNGTEIPGDNKRYYGSTDAIMNSLAPANIKFGPTQICADTEPHATAKALADYLTSIAITEGWSSTEDAKLKALYLNLIKKDAVIAGSSANVEAFVNVLYNELGAESIGKKALAEAVKSAITSKATVSTVTGGTYSYKVTLSSELSGFPASIGLPDGAAAIKWDGEKFEPQTMTTVESTINNVTRFAYPAELYYFCNSTILTSDNELDKAVYQENNTWEDVLTNYTTGNVVNSATKSAAMVSPVQYAVARLRVSLDYINNAAYPLTDANGEEVVWDDTSFPLTAVIVGSQYPVGFDFVPETASEGADETAMRFVYDPELRTNKKADGTYDYYYLNQTANTGYTNTLVLQSYEGENVKVVLEFENRSGYKFTGHDGVVYPGTKFYLIGEVDPVSVTSTQSNNGRVFTQDYSTTFNVAVESFKNAYNVMPDLLSSRMEIGIKVAKWETIRPITVELQQ